MQKSVRPRVSSLNSPSSIIITVPCMVSSPLHKSCRNSFMTHKASCQWHIPSLSLLLSQVWSRIPIIWLSIKSKLPLTSSSGRRCRTWHSTAVGCWRWPTQRQRLEKCWPSAGAGHRCIISIKTTVWHAVSVSLCYCRWRFTDRLWSARHVESWSTTACTTRSSCCRT